MAEVLAAARFYLAQGYAPIPLYPRDKVPKGEAWQNRRLDADTVADAFEPNDNIGLLLGEPSQGLVDIDCDCPYARRLAPAFLPATPMVSGRRSAPDSHYWYRAVGAATRKFQDPELTDDSGKRKVIVELRSTGCQSVVPPSVHPSGEVYQWKQSPPPAPAQVDAGELLQCVKRLAAAALLASRWKEGARHELALCVAGALARAGWSEADAAHFITAVANAAGDREQNDRRRAVNDTYESIQQGDAATGLPRLAEILGRAVAEKIAEWLSLRRETPTAPANGDAKQEREAASLRLAKAALEQITELFTAQDGALYLTWRRNGHTETHALKSRAVENYLAALCNELGYVPRESTISEAVAVLRGEAARRGDTREVHIRIGGNPAQAIYLDLCTPDWRVVEITPAGWRVIPYSDCPIRFIRPRHAHALPIPTRGRIEDLRIFLRISDADFLLILGWLLMAFRPDAPYPILALRGEQGSGKSTATRLLRELTDPRSTPHAAAPHKLDDLMVQAAQAHVVAYDNLSRIPPWLSDALCRLATGAGLEKRELYTDSEVIALHARRPVMMNAIREIVERPDLADRTLQVELLSIPEQERMPERDLLAAWQGARAGILGALLEGVSYAMRTFQSLRLPNLPRMADFAVWAAAGVQAYGYTAQAFLNAYDSNRAALTQQLTERDLLATAIVELMAEREVWEGTASELLQALQESAGEGAHLPKPNKLKNRMLEIAPLLRSHGIRYIYRREDRARVHRLEKLPIVSSGASVSSATPQLELNSADDCLTIQADDTAVPSGSIVRQFGASVNSTSDAPDASDDTDDTVGDFPRNALEEDSCATALCTVGDMDRNAVSAESPFLPIGEIHRNGVAVVSPHAADSGAAIPEFGEARRQAILRRYLQQQGYLNEGDTPEARAAREQLLLDAAARAGYPSIQIGNRRTGEGEAYWRVQARTLAMRPLECAIAIELFARAAGASPRRCLDCGARFSSESALFCARCYETAGACPHCGAARRNTQIFDGETGICYGCRRRFPLPDAVRTSHGAESIPNAQAAQPPANCEGG